MENPQNPTLGVFQELWEKALKLMPIPQLLDMRKAIIDRHTIAISQIDGELKDKGYVQSNTSV